MRARDVVLLLALLGSVRGLAAQSVLERTPNLHGVWTLDAGSAAFVFAHRFELISGGDELFNVPTLSLALGLPLGFTAGLDYSSFSEIVESNRAGNEAQYWVKRRFGLSPSAAVAGLLGYNSAARSIDAAVTGRQSVGPFSLSGELRGFSDLFGTGTAAGAGAVGLGVRLTPYLGVNADIGRVLTQNSFPSVWSAAVAVAIPGTPHTFSLQATNGGAITMQGAVREKVLGAEEVRYGFVFTVPLGTGSQWSRIVRPPAAAATAAVAERPDSVAARVEIRMIAFGPNEVRIKPGQSVEWVNRDPVVHTATANDRSWSSELLQEGQRYVRRFDRPGRYPYHCVPHPQMTGVVIVEEP